MKSFLQLVQEEEQAHKPVVIAFGRMNPPTTGHLKLIDKVREVANKRKAKHKVIVSHSQDAKKNPLSGEQKVKHLKRYSPGTHFEASSKDKPTILHHAAALHATGHDHLTVVAGSDRVKEMHDLLHKYNGVEGRHGHYNFKKINVVSAGHRDPDAEGEEGMSGTKMREHAKNKDFHEFRKGVPHHVSDAHARELMRDTRKGMGLNEQVDRGMFKAVFVTGGPGSGKDVIIREAIAEAKAVELNVIQAIDYLADKQKLSERTNDYRRETIRNRGPIIINGPADDNSISHIREELEELGYETMMIFVHTSNEVSKERNEKLNRMMSESIRLDKWKESQKFHDAFVREFKTALTFDNSYTYAEIEDQITETYVKVNEFIDNKSYNDIAFSWLESHNKLNINETFNYLFKEKTDVTKDSKSIQAQTTKRYNPRFIKAAGPADISPENSGKRNPLGQGDQIKGNSFPRKDPNGRGHSGGAWSGAYSTEEAGPTLKVNPPKKEPNFNYDNDKIKKQKRGNTSLSAGRVGRPDGIGSTYDTRAGGQGAAAGAGLGQNIGESEHFSNAQSTTALPGSSAMSPNPLSSAWDPEKKKSFNKLRKTMKEWNGFINDVESGVGGTLGGADNKEKMQSYRDNDQKMKMAGILIKKKKGAK
jgi:predicted kinase